MMPLNHILSKCTAGYKLSKLQLKMDEDGWHQTVWKRIKTQIETVRIYSEDVKIEFGTEKYAMLVMKRGKREMREGIELPNQEKIRTLG